MTEYSGNIWKNLRYLGIVYNEKAVVVLTNKKVPLYLKIIASLGKNFNHAPDMDDRTIIDALVTADKIINTCVSPLEFLIMKPKCINITSEIKNGNLRAPHLTNAQQYIRHLYELSRNFLMENRSIIVLSSDKGGKAVIMDRSDYYNKMDQHINENVSCCVYQEVQNRTIESIQKSIETIFKQKIKNMNQYLLLDGLDSYRLFRPEPFLIPRMYGCPKVHKPNIPMRPIISSPEMIGSSVSDWLLSHLKTIAEHLGRYNVENSIQLFSSLKFCTLEQGHILCSYDYVSMFTNVNVNDTEEIIRKF